MTPHEELMLNELADCWKDLSEWEQGFVSNIRDQTERFPNSHLTEKQYDKLQELWERHCDD